jgi:Na+/H+ antiporter NhaC
MDFIGAMGDASASTALAYGSLVALILAIIYMLMRRTVTFDQTMDCIPQGFKNMVPAITILVFAWAICAMTRYGLGAPQFVESIVQDGGALMNFLPALFMLLACFISFSTGTSWGTFGIMLPIVYAAFAETNPELMIIGISACLSGAVFGDHCSPISDTTIMSSAGAQCSHMNHVTTQVPYALTVAGMSFIFFLIAGFWQSIIVTVIGAICMVVLLVAMKKLQDKGVMFVDKTG